MEKQITISAYATDYNDKCYKLYFARNGYEFIPKSRCKLVEAPAGISDSQPQSCYFEIPLWIANKLKGMEYYSII